MLRATTKGVKINNAPMVGRLAFADVCAAKVKMSIAAPTTIPRSARMDPEAL
jgi:hypothetical protein